MTMMHPWSSDPTAQAAIRRAEDGRSEPVPTLAEVIKRHRGLMPKSVSVSTAETLRKKVEHMRESVIDYIDTDATIDERVVTNHDAAPTARGGESQCAERATIGGTKRDAETRINCQEIIDCSIRVVPSAEAGAEIRQLRSNVLWSESVRLSAIRERDAAYAEIEQLGHERDIYASNEQAALRSWMKALNERDAAHAEIERLRRDRDEQREFLEHAESERDEARARVAELEGVTKSQSAIPATEETSHRTLLTEEEREAVEAAISALDAGDATYFGVVLRGLLKRAGGA